MVLNSDRHQTTERYHSEYKLDSTLTIKNLQSHDFGSYQCVSKNSLGDSDGTILLYALETATEPHYIETAPPEKGGCGLAAMAI